MAQHYKNESITRSRVKVFLGWEYFNPKGNVAPARRDQNLCSKLWTDQDRSAVSLSVTSLDASLTNPTRRLLESFDFQPAKVGDKFGPSFANHLFRLDITVPQSFHNQPVHLQWDSNSEALVLNSDGLPRQGLVGGNHWAHRGDYPLFPHRKDSIAQGGEQLTLYIEIACNGLFGAGRGGDIEPPDMNKYYDLEECCLAVFNPVAWGLIHDVTLLSSLVDQLPNNPRRAQALHTANEVVNVVDVFDPTTYEKGRQLASTFLQSKNGDSQAVVHAMIHSHIDLAWLWPMASTPAKGGRTFSTHLRLMEQYPQCVYVQSQAQLFDWVKQKYPKLWVEVCQRVEEGRIVPVGATWVEMDCNIPCGESLIRQFVLGQEFFMSNFGMRCKEFWLPDTFGYAAQLPQIMKGCGVDNFLTQKLSWNLFNKFPHSTFIWEGLDGTQVLAHMPPADTYNSQALPEEVIRSAEKNKDCSVINQSVLLVGHGDGGGGASPAHVESIRRMKDLEGIAKVEFSTPDRFFAEVKKQEKSLARWIGELYFELHRGTYTTQSVTKKYNRGCENLLRDVEMSGVIGMLVGNWSGTRFEYGKEVIEECWKLVLKNCFHDTLPGSCIGEVYEETERDYKYVLEEGTKEMDRCVEFVMDGMKNGERKRYKKENGWVASGGGGGGGGSRTTNEFMMICKQTGSVNETEEEKEKGMYVAEVEMDEELIKTGCYYQPVGEGGFGNSCTEWWKEKNTRTKSCLVGIKQRPTGIGICRGVQVLGKEEIQQKGTVTISERPGEQGTEYVIKNDKLQATIQSSGKVTSAKLVSPDGTTRESLAHGETCGNRLVLYDDVAQFWCGWDTEVYSFEKWVDIGAATSCTVLERGPLRVALQFEYEPTAAGSKIWQIVRITNASARMDFCTKVDWKENRKILRALFETNVRSSEACYDSQFGYVKRATTMNHSWQIAQFEAVGHQFCDVSEWGFGVALLNDCKYGYAVRQNLIRLSLLRASKCPDDAADIGEHVMTYSMLPHWGAFPQRSVVDEAHELNWPCRLYVAKGEYMGVQQCMFEMKSGGTGGEIDSVFVSAVKKAEKKEDCVVVRMFEAFGGRGKARLQCPAMLRLGRVSECNMLEEEVGEIEIVGMELVLEFKPFQIRTIMLHLVSD